MSKLKIVEERYVVTTKDKKEIIRGEYGNKNLEKINNHLEKLPRVMLYCESGAKRAIPMLKNKYLYFKTEKEFEKIKVRVTIEEIE